MGERYRDKGYGTKSLRLIVDFAFNKLNMNKVKLSVFDFNVGAKKCYDKVGFAQGSAEECRYYLILVKDLGYVEISDAKLLLQEVSKLLEAYVEAF